MRILKSLKSKKGRDETGLFFLEGEKFVREIPAGWKIRQYVVAKRFAEGRDLSEFELRARCEVVRDSIFDGLADTVNPQGILAVCEKYDWRLEDALVPGGFVLLGECLNDPGNIGALIRTAAAAGASGVILTDGSGDIFNPKVLRAAAGAVLRMPVVSNVSISETVSALKQSGYSIYAAHLRGEVLPYNLDLTTDFCLIVGNESHGITNETANHADVLIRLPMTNDTESLNASVAGSILLYEAVRQRLGN